LGCIKIRKKQKLKEHWGEMRQGAVPPQKKSENGRHLWGTEEMQKKTTRGRLDPRIWTGSGERGKGRIPGGVLEKKKIGPGDTRPKKPLKSRGRRSNQRWAL